MDNLSWQRNSKEMIESTLTKVGLERQRMRAELEAEMDGRRLKYDSKTVKDAATSATLEERCRQIARRRMYAAFFWWRPGCVESRKPKLHLQRQVQAAMIHAAQSNALGTLASLAQMQASLTQAFFIWLTVRLEQGAHSVSSQGTEGTLESGRQHKTQGEVSKMFVCQN